MPFAVLPDACATATVEALHSIGGNVGLSIEVVDAVLGSPGDTVLEHGAAAEINSDPALKAIVVHSLPPWRLCQQQNMPFAVSQPIDVPVIMRAWERHSMQ